MSEQQVNDVDTELTKIKSTSSDAGSVTFISVDEAIKLDKYKRKLAQQEQRKGFARVSLGVSRYKEF